jgi:hypothetical protein
MQRGQIGLRRWNAGRTAATPHIYFAYSAKRFQPCWRVLKPLILLVEVKDWRRERDSNPRWVLATHAFQACALNHSAISPPKGRANLEQFPKGRNGFLK